MHCNKLALLLLTCLLPLSAAGQPYASDFGFSTEISDNWLIVSRQRLAQNPDLLNFDALKRNGIDPAMADLLRNKVAAGDFELLYYRHSDRDFKDNINVFISSPRRSDLDRVAGPLCANLPSEIRKAHGRIEHAETYGCELKRLYGVDTISYAFDGAVIGSRSYGFLFNSKRGSVTMTITCKVAKCPEVFADAEAIFRNMRI